MYCDIVMNPQKKSNSKVALLSNPPTAKQEGEKQSVVAKKRMKATSVVLSLLLGSSTSTASPLAESIRKRLQKGDLKFGSGRAVGLGGVEQGHVGINHLDIFSRSSSNVTDANAMDDDSDTAITYGGKGGKKGEGKKGGKGGKKGKREFGGKGGKRGEGKKGESENGGKGKVTMSKGMIMAGKGGSKGGKGASHLVRYCVRLYFV